MSRSMFKRTSGTAVASALAAGLLLAALASPVAARPTTAHQCDYTFAPGGGTYIGDIAQGEVFCGSADTDVLQGFNYGTFYGNGGRDVIGGNNDGTFWGGAGADVIVNVNNGTFYGQGGDDAIGVGSSGWNAGTFYGQDGNDWVNFNNGSMYGADGDDQVLFQVSGLFSGGSGDDTVLSFTGGTCKSVTGC